MLKDPASFTEAYKLARQASSLPEGITRPVASVHTMGLEEIRKAINQIKTSQTTMADTVREITRLLNKLSLKRFHINLVCYQNLHFL